MFRRIGAVLAVGAAVLGLNVLTSSPAQAVWTTCESGKVCLWSEPNATGANIHESNPPAGDGCINLPAGAARNNAESVWNRRTTGVLDLWTGLNCSGSVLVVAIGGQISTIGATWSNNVESYRAWGG